MSKTSENKTILINEKNNEKISDIKFAYSYFSRLKGLMFKKDLNYVLILKPPKKNKSSMSSIHTCFMKIDIDIAFLDENKIVYEMKHLKPWKFYTPKHGASYILELKKGSIEKHDIKIGDKLDFVCEFR